ncbi:MAG: transketolase [Micrococcales bacterium]|nr:transketolase [Micrococcales bacterium]MCL2666644.1 transketolase [Micrococcales bacterium]
MVRGVKAPTATVVGWTDLDIRAVDTARVLSADAVEKAGNGHPGAAISLAPAAYLLYQSFLRHDPADPAWLGRDRFVLSCGHSALTQYVQLFFAGFGLDLDDLKALRTWDSATPGHPEHGRTAGVEITTGPLGQGLASAVGMAMAARRERGLLDPDAPVGTSPFDHQIVVLASDGDIQEGISAEAGALAGTQELGNLLVLWDDNRISIEGDTKVAFTEDVVARHDAYGWHTQTVDWTVGGTYTEDIDALAAALAAAKAETSRPSFIALRTLIAWPTPGKTDDPSSHGAKLGSPAVRALKEQLGFDPDATFVVDDEVLAHTRRLRDRAAADHAAWQTSFDAWATANPQRKDLLDRLVARALPEGWADVLPVFEAGTSVATRVASGAAINALAGVLPELWGGSADLGASNNTTVTSEPSFLPAGRSSAQFVGDPYGRTLHFGIREHAMGAIVTGMWLHGLTRPYAGTFFQFADYMRPAVRLGALMGARVVYVWTHDSIGVGEDGPTHQPVEHLAAYRTIPGLAVVRPADANETTAAWAEVLRRDDGPAALVLTRQDVPTFPRGTDGFAQADVARGAYTLLDSVGTPDVVLLATGSEVALAVATRDLLAADGIAARVVSVPCLEWFDEQPQAYRDQVLPPQVRARVSVEAGIALSWHRLVGDHGRTVSLERYGASASPSRLFTELGFTPEAVVAAARESLAAARAARGSVTEVYAQA